MTTNLRLVPDMDRTVVPLQRGPVVDEASNGGSGLGHSPDPPLTLIAVDEAQTIRMLKALRNTGTEKGDHALVDKLQGARVRLGEASLIALFDDGPAAA